MARLKFHTFLLSCSIHPNSFHKEGGLIVLNYLLIALINDLLVAHIDGFNRHSKFKERGFINLRSFLLEIVDVLLADIVDRISRHSERLLLLLLSLYALDIVSSCLLVRMPVFMNLSKFSVEVESQLLMLIGPGLLLRCSVKGRA